MGGTKVLRMVLSQKDLYGVLPNAVGAMRRLDSSLNMNILKKLFSPCNTGPIKVNQKMAFFRSAIWKTGKLNISLGQKLGIENLGMKPKKNDPNSRLLSQRAIIY